MSGKSLPPLRGRGLLQALLDAAETRKLTSVEFHRRYGVGVTWLSDLRAGRTKSPNVDTVQRIYEDLTGSSLLK